jgi:hypothetical protein
MEEIDITAHVEHAVENFKKGYNCAQSVVLAYADLYPADMETVKMISAPFGAGMGRLREVCGAYCVAVAAEILGEELVRLREAIVE